MNVQAPRRSDLPHGRSILTGLAKEHLSRFLQNATSVSLLKNQVLFKRGAPGDGCYWLRKGILKVIVASPTGEERVLAILGPGSVVGELAVIDALPRSATVQGITDCQLTFVSGPAFKAWLQDNPEVYGHLVLTLVARLRQADEEIAAASFLTVNARIARALIQLAEHFGQPTGGGWVEIVHRIRQNDLASMAGVARESVSRTLSDWGRQDIVSKRSPSHYVVHMETLQHEATGSLR